MLEVMQYFPTPHVITAKLPTMTTHHAAHLPSMQEADSQCIAPLPRHTRAASYASPMYIKKPTHTMRRIILLCTLALSLAALPAWGQQQSQEQMASHYFQNKEYDKAIELYAPLYQRTQNKFYYQMLLESYLATEQLKEAERLVEKRMKQRPSELFLFVDLAQTQLLAGEKKKAEKSLAAPLDRLGFDSQQLADLVQAYQNAGRNDLAVQAYLALRKKSRNATAYVMELATLYQRMGNYEAMTDEYFALLDAAPGNMGSIQISLQRALNETSSPQLAQGLRRTIMSRIQKDPSNRTYLDMMIWFSLQQSDFQFALQQARSIDQRFPGEGEEQILRVAAIARNNEDFATALEAYRYIVKKGQQGNFYFESRVGEMQTRFEQMSSGPTLPQASVAALKADYDRLFDELGKNLQTVPLMRDCAHLMAYHQEDVEGAAELLYDILDLPKLPARERDEVKLELGDLLLFAGSLWDASLLYSQVEKANPNDLLGAQAKLRNARLAYFNNDFTWAKSQLDVLRASTSKLIANDAMELSLLISDNMEVDSTFDMLELYAAADLLLYRNQLDAAWEAFAAVAVHSLSHPLLDEVLLQQARIRIRQQRYLEADSLLQKLLDLYSADILADDALMLQAEINETYLHRPERAIACYERLLLDYPASLYVDRARRRYNELRR